MTKSKPLCRMACAIALSACVAAPALATESGFYLGATVGESKYDVSDETTGLFDVTTGVRTGDSDTNFTLAFGYRFNPYIGLELAYLDLGQLTVDELGSKQVSRGAPPAVPVPTRYSQGFVELDAGSKGPTLSFVGSLPLAKFELFGKIGAMIAHSTVRQGIYTTTADSATNCTTNCTWVFPNAGLTNDSATTNEVLFAAGAGYTIGDSFFVKIEYLMIPGLGEEGATGTIDVESLSLGFQYRF